MKKICFSLLLLSSFSMMRSNVLLLEGRYQNKNIYIQNGLANSGVGFCAYEVKVNGKVTTDEVNSTAFEIDLSTYKLTMGEKVTVEIYHKEDCKPKVLNPEAFKPKPSFEIGTITINTEGLLKWNTTNESGPLPYIVEQFKWNKWVYVGTVEGVGTPEKHDYLFKVTAHSGENKFRVKQVGFGGVNKTSNPVVYNCLIETPNYKVTDKTINFSSDTGFEMYDPFGNVVKKGFGNVCDVSNLGKGKYYLCYDNIVTELDKRK
ncbi:MAG: hypothetical protein IAF38_07970 [Bacteroidia bacterium]|nr:hypothetical protein [Bacteroidia bacterium]